MRLVRLSKTFLAQLDAILEYGYPQFGARVITEKRDLVFDRITNYLALFPKRPVDPNHGLIVYAVARTPFKLIYDFDEHQLRVHFIFHVRASLEDIDPASAVW